MELVPVQHLEDAAGSWRVLVATATGHVRAHNEDRYQVLLDLPFQGRNVQCVAVFDGVGGIPNGEAAAQAAADHLERAVLRSPDPKQILPRLNEAVLETGGGTTAVIALLEPAGGWLLSIGDSPAYETGRRGSPKPLNPLDSAGQPILTDHLGRDGAGGHVRRIAVPAGQALVLCSDGVEHAPETALRSLLEVKGDKAAVAIQGIFAALERAGAPDNTTVLVAQHREAE